MERGEERRKFLRVEDFRPIWFRLVEEHEYKQQGHGFQKDIGGGGIRLLTSNKLDLGQWIELNLELPGPPPFSLAMLGEVVWRREMSDEHERMFAHGVRFLDLPESERRKIVQHCYRKQKKYRSTP